MLNVFVWAGLYISKVPKFQMVPVVARNAAPPSISFGIIGVD